MSEEHAFTRGASSHGGVIVGFPFLPAQQFVVPPQVITDEELIEVLDRSDRHSPLHPTPVFPFTSLSSSHTNSVGLDPFEHVAPHIVWTMGRVHAHCHAHLLDTARVQHTARVQQSTCPTNPSLVSSHHVSLLMVKTGKGFMAVEKSVSAFDAAQRAQ